MSIIPHGGVAPASPVKYDPLSRTLHWIFAAIIIYTMIGGISLHIITNHALLHFVSTLNMSLASCLFVLFPIRYLWTFFRSEPAEIESIPATQRSIAHAVHSLIYALVALVLVSGFVMVPDGYPLFGLFYIHTPFSEGTITQHWFQIHRICCYALLVLVVLHAGAALKHHLVSKNGVLKKML